MSFQLLNLYLQVKQSWHLNDKTFLPTSNARNTSMLREAAVFADHLKHCEKDIRNLKNASEGETNYLNANSDARFDRCTLCDAIEGLLRTACP